MALAETWYGRTVRKLHLDYHQPPWMRDVAAAVTPEYAGELARMFRESGVQAVEVFALDHYGYTFYPSEVGVTHPGLVGDYTGTMVRALRGEGIRPIAYMNVFTSVHLHETHPEWVVTAPDGHQPRGAWLQHEASGLCPSSPYLREYFLPQLREVIERFDVDAVWLDGGSWMAESLCWCGYCQQQFREATGLELPHAMPERPRHDHPARVRTASGATTTQQWTTRDDPGEDDTWVAWRTWRRGQIADYLAEVTGAARAVKPSVLVGDNGTGYWSTPIVATDRGRFQQWLTPRETGVDFLTGDPVPFGGNHALLLSREARYHATTGLPFEYHTERFHKWGEWQLRSPVDQKLEFATVLALGGTCFMADQPYPDGSLEPAVYAQLRDGYAFVAEREPFIQDSRMVPDVAILASAPSQLFGPIGNGRDAGRRTGLVGGDASVGQRTDRVAGAHLVTIEQGAQCLIYNEPTLRERLDEQSLVIVAEQCLLEDETIDALRTWVANGGGLLVTGRTGEWDEQGRLRDNSQLYDLLGLEAVRELPSPVHYFRLGDALRGDDAIPDLPVQAWGTAVEVRPTSATVLAQLHGPLADVWRAGVEDEEHWQQYTTLGSCPPDTHPVAPGITLNAFGKGRVGYIAVDPFAAYHHDGHRLTRMMVQRLLDLVTPPEARRLATRKPMNVEVSLQQQEGRLIVHLLNYFAQKRSSSNVSNEEIMPVFDIEVCVRTERKPARVTLQPAGEDLPWSHEDGRVIVRVPKLEIHTMVVIEEQG